MNEENGLPRGWAWTRVGEIYNIVGGGTPSTDIEEYWNGDIAWVTSADIYGLKDIRPRKRITKTAIENSATNLVPEDSLIVVTRVGLGKVALTKKPLCFSQDSQALIGVSSSIYPDYSLYFLSQSVQVFKYQNRGTTIAGVTKKQLSELPFALPPLSEQQRIVATIEQQFSRLDAGIAALRRAQAKLKRYRAAVLKAAVEGKLTEAWRDEHPTTEPASKLLERILVERRAKWEADLKAKGKDPAKVRYVEPAKPDVESLPELPEGWCWATIGQLTWSVKDGPHYSPEYISEGIPFITGGNVRPSSVDFTNARYITPELHAKLSRRCKPEKGDILYTKGGTTGIACVNTYDTEFSVWVHVAVLKLSGPIEPFYVQHALNSPSCYTQAQLFTHGVGNQDLGLTRMVRIVLSLPPLAEQEQIVAEIERRLSVIDHLETIIEANLKRAERLRQSILKEAFAGHLVPQDPDDESAAVLLERIRGEREKRKHGVLDKGREVICEVAKPKKIDVMETRQVELWESGSSGE